jgi:hypothetical protein
MTPDEINRAIAESVGWKFIPCHDDELGRATGESWLDPDGDTAFDCPNYHGDLNAIQGVVAESFTSNESLDAFAENLAVVIFGSYPDALLRYSDAAMMVNATAPQRCEAYLKTIGKWRDQ